MKKRQKKKKEMETFLQGGDWFSYEIEGEEFIEDVGLDLRLGGDEGVSHTGVREKSMLDRECCLGALTLEHTWCAQGPARRRPCGLEGARGWRPGQERKGESQAHPACCQDSGFY